jgi:Chemoreceptor zinc-binding domain
MNFDEAISAHAQWKQKLKSYTAKPDGSLKAADVQTDNKCPLGQWIYGEGHKYNALPEFRTLKDEHMKFHKAAADIINRADAKEDVSKELAVGQKTAFLEASSSVVRAIVAMKQKV